MPQKIYPAYVQVNNTWVKVGKAIVDEARFGAVNIIIDEDAPTTEALKSLMESRVTAVSVDGNVDSKNVDEACDHDFQPRWEGDRDPDCVYCGEFKPTQQDPHEPHNHKPVQHRDRKVPWCNECGLDKNHRYPILSARFPV